MTTEPRKVIERWAEELLAAMGGTLERSERVTAAADGVLCIVLVCRTGERLPTARGERTSRQPGGRRQCRADVMAVVRAARRGMTSKEIAAALRAAGHDYGAGTLEKALAELTAGGELVNPRDRLGYRLPDWLPPRPPTLFQG